MYHNKIKMAVIFLVFSIIFAGCGYVAVMLFFYIVLAATKQIHTIGDVYSFSFFMFGSFSLFATLSFKKLQKTFRARKMAKYFEKDADGLVSIEELACYLKMKRHKCFALFLDCVGRNLLRNCTVFSEDPTYLLLDNGKENRLEKFVVKHCPKCGAPSTLRIGFENTCKYCGAVVMERADKE